MNITCKLFEAKTEGNVKAYGSITIDDCFAVQIKVMTGKNGEFVSFPNRKAPDGTYKDVAFPTTKEARLEILECVMNEYKKLIGEEAFDENSDEFPFE